MPIYEYRCPECSHKFEKLVRMNSAAPSCPQCGHEEVQKLISAAGFILKGGGWYKDHYGLKSTPGTSSDGGSTGEGGGGSDGGGGSEASASSSTASATTNSSSAD